MLSAIGNPGVTWRKDLGVALKCEVASPNLASVCRGKKAAAKGLFQALL